MSIPSLSIRRPVAVTMLFVAIVFLGGLSFTRLPVDLLPNIAYPKLVVYTTYPDVAPAEVERFVTEKIEGVVSTVPGVEKVESSTREGVSLVILRFAWGTDMDFAALNVREKVDGLRGTLPDQASHPVVLRTDPRSEPVMALSVAGGSDLWSLKELAENVFRRRLEQIDGVAQASVTGGLEREIHVDVDATKLDSYGVKIEDVSTALAAANASAPSGMVMRGSYRYALRTLGELQSVDQIGAIVVAQRAPGAATGSAPEGRVLLRDIAHIEDGFKDRESIARYNGEEAVGLLVFKEAGANTVRVAERVNEVLDQLRQQYPTVHLDVAMSQAGFVSGAISNLVQQMIMGAILAFLVLILFLRDPRYPIAISVAIPISVIATFGLFQAAGVTLNIMSLGGLALGVGMLVDNSIVVIENIFRHREKEGIVTAAAAALGTEEVQRAITASTLTTIAVFAPIIYVEGVAGQLFASLSFAVAFSLVASLVVAVTLLPTMAARWHAPVNRVYTPAPGWRGRVWTAVRGAVLRPLYAFDRQFLRFTDFYERTLASALRHRGRVVLITLVMLAVTVPIALDLHRSVLPDVDQGSFRARIELPRGTPLERTAETAATLEGLIRQDPAVEAVFSRIGKQTAMEGVEEEETGLNTAVLEVRLKDGQHTHPVLNRLRPKLNRFAPGTVVFETGTATELGELLGGGEADLAVRVRNDDLDASLAYAQQLEGKLAEAPELTNVRLGTELGQPEYLVEINRDRAAQFGIRPERIANTVETYMRGTTATQFLDFDQKIPIVVRLPEAARRSLATLQTLRLDEIPLSQLVTVRETVGPVEIRRLDQNRYVPVFADVARGGIGGAVARAQQIVNANPPPRGTRVDIGGENEEMRRSFRNLGLAFGLAILLVYMILAGEFESLIHPVTILLTVPLSLIGAVLMLGVFGSGFNTVSLIGIVILVGIVQNDAIVKVDFINQLRREGMPIREAIMAAGHARLRPILMTTITTIFAILPMMLGFGPGAGLQAPLAVAVFGGLTGATLLTLIVIPVAYALVDDGLNWVRARTGGTSTVEAHPESVPQAGTPETAVGD